MPQSLKKRFNGQSEEILRDTELYGQYTAMEKWGIKDLLAFRRFLKDKTDNPDYGLNAKYIPSSGANLGEQLLQAMANYIIKTKDNQRGLEARIRALEWELELKERENRNRVAPLLQELNSV